MGCCARVLTLEGIGMLIFGAATTMLTEFMPKKARYVYYP